MSRPLHKTWRYRLARWLLRDAAKALPVVPAWVRESSLTPSFANLTKEGYQKNSAVFACISALALGIAEPPLVVRDARAAPLPEHPLSRLLARPNPLMGQAELLMTIMCYTAIGGNAYGHIVRGLGGEPAELWPYHAGQMRPVPGGDTWVQGYEFDTGDGNWRQVPAEDVLHFKWPSPDPTQPWQAQPPLRAPAAEVDADNEMTRYLAALLANDAMPRTVLTTPTGAYPDDDAVKRMKQQWRERYGGDARGDVAVLEEGVSVARLSLNLQELAFEALHAVPESRIAAALRVPPIIAGLNVGLNRSTFANYGEARRSFTQDTLVPFWRLISGEIQSGLLGQFRYTRATSVSFDLAQVASLAEGAAAIRARALDSYTRGALTRNETRAEIGYAPAADGDLFVEEVEALAMLGPLQLPAPGQPEQRARELGARLELKARSTARTEAAMRRALQRYLAEQYELAASAAEGA